jgi:hypothetical protein
MESKMMMHNFQPGIGDICTDTTGLQVKVEDIDIYNYVHFSVIEDRHRVMTKHECQAVDLRQYPADSICGTCHQMWGEHVGLQCPHGQGEFVPVLSRYEEVTQEIRSEKVGETKRHPARCLAWLSSIDS